MDGWIKLQRKILRWRWVNNLPTLRVFLQILLLAEWEGPWAGTLRTNTTDLALDTKLTVRQVRRALENLVRTGEIKRARSGHDVVITVVNYRAYQGQETGQEVEQGLSQQNQEDNPCVQSAPGREEGKTTGNNSGADGATPRAQSGRNQTGSFLIIRKEQEKEQEQEQPTTPNPLQAAGAESRPAEDLVVGGGGGNLDFSLISELTDNGVDANAAAALVARTAPEAVRNALDYVAHERKRGARIANLPAFTVGAVKNLRAPTPAPVQADDAPKSAAYQPVHIEPPPPPLTAEQRAEREKIFQNIRARLRGEQTTESAEERIEELRNQARAMGE